MTNALHGADPDAVAECPRCGARVRVAMVGRHDRDHEWDDELERRVEALERSGTGRLVDWPGDGGDGIEPDPVGDSGPIESVEVTPRSFG